MSSGTVIPSGDRISAGIGIPVHPPLAKMGGLVLGLVLLTLAAGCNALDFAPLATATKTVSEVFQTDDAPKIVVETFNGSIDVSRGDVDEVVVEVTKRASGFDPSIAESALETIQLSMIQTEGTIHITARRAGRSNGNAGAAVIIVAPAKAQLQLKSTNGHIVCEELQGAIKATTSNGKLEIIEARGPLDLASSNGNIDVEAIGAAITAHTSNGRIQFQGSLAAGEHQFRTSNGSIDLLLPPGSQFALSASTSNAHVDCEFGIEAEGKQRRSRLQGKVGENPACTISAVSSNGHVAIRKAAAAN